MSDGATIVWIVAIVLAFIFMGAGPTTRLIIRTVIRAGIWRNMR